MNFDEAFKAMESGKSIVRASWAKFNPLSIFKDGMRQEVMRSFPGDNRLEDYNLTVDDYKADDWIVYEYTLTPKAMGEEEKDILRKILEPFKSDPGLRIRYEDIGDPDEDEAGSIEIWTSNTMYYHYNLGCWEEFRLPVFINMCVDDDLILVSDLGLWDSQDSK